MKICAACCEELPQESFSKKQWQLKQHQRRCKRCIDANRELQLKPPPKSDSPSSRTNDPPAHYSIDEDDVSCWICLCEGPDDNGQPLRRDCSCRGADAGFAHLSCIVEYAEQKSRQINGGVMHPKTIHQQISGRDFNKFREPWEQCASCLQNHQNDLAVDLATEFVKFVEDKYPDNLPLKLESFVLHLEALQGMMARLDQKQRDEAKSIACTILFLIGQMEAQLRSVPKRITLAEAVTYSILGKLVLNERTQESAKEALICFEKCKVANRRIGNKNGVALSETYIAIAKNKCEGEKKASMDEMVEKIRPVYEQRVVTLGPEAQMTVLAGLDLARALEKANRMLEAERLLTKLASISRRVQGPDHKTTKKAEAHLVLWQARYVSVQFQHQWFLFQALRYEDDYTKVVIQGPVETVNARNVDKEETMTVDVSEIRPSLDTIVTCHGLEGEQEHLNGKIGELVQREDMSGFYDVYFEDKELKPWQLKYDNLRIVFELPEEEG